MLTEVGNILRAETTPQGGKFYFQNVQLEVCFLTEDLIRIDWQPGVLPGAIARCDGSEVEVKFAKTLSDR